MLSGELRYFACITLLSSRWDSLNLLVASNDKLLSVGIVALLLEILVLQHQCVSLALRQINVRNEICCGSGPLFNRGQVHQIVVFRPFIVLRL